MKDFQCCAKSKELVEIIHKFHSKGWSQATGTNYSYRSGDAIVISQSGKDKGLFSFNDLMLVNSAGEALEPASAKPSYETLLHTIMYERPEINCVLHTHSSHATVLSLKYLEQQEILFSQYEVMKGIDGITTHDTIHALPIFPNSQNIPALSQQIKQFISENSHIKGYLLAGHGLYSWGKDMAQAKHHIETYEFLLECHFKDLLLQGT